MPDFRGILDQAQFKPTTGPITTTGSNAQGQEQTWTNPRPQLDQSSAQQLAQLLGATLVPVNGGGGPYSQDKPQYNLDWNTGNKHDAAMLAENYATDAPFFNQNLADEMASDARPSVAMQEYLARTGSQGPAAPPSPLPALPAQRPPGPLPAPPHGTPQPGGPPGGSNIPGPVWPNVPPTTVPGPTWPQAPPANRPGPTWPAPGPANAPGPAWTLPPLPPMPQGPQIVQYPGSGVRDPGGYTLPPGFQGQFPYPVDMQEPSGARNSIKRPGGLLNSFQQYGGLLG